MKCFQSAKFSRQSSLLELIRNQKKKKLYKKQKHKCDVDTEHKKYPTKKKNSVTEKMQITVK